MPTCSGCHQPNTTIHEYCQRSIRDLPILGRAVRLNVELRRVGCSTCGKRMESVRWLDRYSRMTRRLADAVIQACQDCPLSTSPSCLVCIGTACACWSDGRYKTHRRSYRRRSPGAW
ncbi:transposase family protein [Halopseudomonas pachastrellae]|nr:transposase family protein [Halopseudomonas pachastrellae]